MDMDLVPIESIDIQDDFFFPDQKKPRLTLCSFDNDSIITSDNNSQDYSTMMMMMIMSGSENGEGDGDLSLLDKQNGLASSHPIGGDQFQQADCSTTSTPNAHNTNNNTNNSSSNNANNSSDSMMMMMMMSQSEQTFAFPPCHPRHACTSFPYHFGVSSFSNSTHCSKCWCFICDEAAPCAFWGTGMTDSDHCNLSSADQMMMVSELNNRQCDISCTIQEEDAGSHLYINQQQQQQQHETNNMKSSGSGQQMQVASSISSLSTSSCYEPYSKYGFSSLSLPTQDTQERHQDNHHHQHEPSDLDCYSSCPTSIVPTRVYTDPSSDPQLFEFGCIYIPLRMQHPETLLVDIVDSCEKFSLEIFAEYVGDGKPFQLESMEGGCNYKALMDELLLNEAQGQIQVIVEIEQELKMDNTVASVKTRVFLKKERGDEVSVLKELLRIMFPSDYGLQGYLDEVERMQRWAEKSEEKVSFSELLNDLDSYCYKEAPQPSGLTVPLRPYQLQSLQFMLDAEQREGGLLGVNYQSLPLPTHPPLMYSATLGHLTTSREGSAWGGFLCEEMGLGKTIEILALILANPSSQGVSDVSGCSKGTLIVCPVSIVGQWANEVKSKLAANLSVYMYHGSKRIRDPKRLAKFDIVITTYATLGSDFSKATQATRHGSGFAEQFCPLLSVNWWRVVLDESHTVKDPAPLHSRACARLKSMKRWCCTGTPINTSIYDLYGQFLFLKLEPLDNKETFRRRIGRPYERHCKNTDQLVLLWTLSKMMIRHTKQQKLNGKELLRLPPKTEQDIAVAFTPEERSAYDAVYKKAVAKFDQFRCWGPTIISKNILQIMSLLLPLRRLCSGGFVSNLELNSMEYVRRENSSNISSPCKSSVDVSNGNSSQPANEREVEQMEGECGICFEIMESPTKTPCNHWFCLECIMSSLGSGHQGCPSCGSFISSEQLHTYSKPTGLPPTPTAISATTSFPEESGFEKNTQIIAGVQMQSKLQMLLEDLAKVREENPTAKVLIFSQFTQTIAWLKNEFKNQGVTYRFISGDMPMKKRSQAIEAFQKDPPTTVFLLSIRTGAVGLTLTAASHVYMLEPCLNPALEEQAVGRCWRMGQERPVVIKRLYVENSVEANILKLLRSRQMPSLKSPPSTTTTTSTSSYNSHDSCPEPLLTRFKSGRNNVTDVAGCIRSDKQNLRLNEFEILFSS